MDKPTINYPCPWTYAIIGWDEEDLRMAVGRIVTGRKHQLVFSQRSTGGKYVSLHLEAEVTSEEDRNMIFVALQNDPKIKTVL
jgi:putative lipoic acid-binding regulatory protein